MRMTKAQACKFGIGDPPGVKTRRKKPKGLSPAQILFLAACKAHNLPQPVEEYEFCEGRKWRADYAFPDLDILVEIDGGAWINGRHTRGGGFEEDCVKYAEAICLGWTVLRVTPKMVDDGRLFGWLRRIQGER